MFWVVFSRKAAFLTINIHVPLSTNTPINAIQHSVNGWRGANLKTNKNATYGNHVAFQEALTSKRAIGAFLAEGQSQNSTKVLSGSAITSTSLRGHSRFSTNTGNSSWQRAGYRMRKEQGAGSVVSSAMPLFSLTTEDTGRYGQLSFAAVSKSWLVEAAFP